VLSGDYSCAKILKWLQDHMLQDWSFNSTSKICFNCNLSTSSFKLIY